MHESGAGNLADDSGATRVIPVDALIRTRRRTLAIIIEDDGKVVVRAPLRLARRAIDEFVRSKANWILARQRQARARTARIVPKRYVSGEDFLYLGNRYRLEIHDSQRPSLLLDAGFRLSRTALPRAARVFERWYRQRALQVISERVEFYAAQHRFEHNGIRITAARKQWGSCGPTGNLRFAWRLVMAPLPIIDYVVVHELAHLLHKNHGKRFWSKVKSILPDFKQREAWLKENDHLLHLAAGERPSLRTLHGTGELEVTLTP